MHNVSFCMRCFGNSAVSVSEGVNFCNNCGSEGTCISIRHDEATYLRENIKLSIGRAQLKIVEEQRSKIKEYINKGGK